MGTGGGAVNNTPRPYFFAPPRAPDALLRAIEVYAVELIDHGCLPIVRQVLEHRLDHRVEVASFERMVPILLESTGAEPIDCCLEFESIHICLRPFSKPSRTTYTEEQKTR